MTDALQREIVEAAKAHDGYYLLSRRYGNPVPHDPKRDACDALVTGGYARWLSGQSAYFPGITLTGKPFPEIES